MTQTRTVLPAVGRAGVIEQLGDAVAALVRGQGGTVWLEGEAGIGKTTALSAGLGHAEAVGCVVRWATADEHGRHLPLRPLLDAFGEDAAPAVAMLTGAPSGLWAFGDTVPAVAEWLITSIEEWASERPHVLVLDDVQWADQASLRVWWRLSRVSQQAPLLVIASGRPVPSRQDVLRLRESMTTTGPLISLPPLSAQHVVELAQRHLGRVAGPRLHRFLDAAAGNPLYVQELVDALVRDGVVGYDRGTVELPPALDAQVPPSLVGAVTARLALLSPPARDLVRRACVLGSEFSIIHLATVLHRSPPEIADMIEEATHARILTATGARLRFRHPVIRQALYDELPDDAKLSLHRAAGHALASAAAAVERVADQLLAIHALAGERLDSWAVDWLVGEAHRLGLRAPDVAVLLLGRVTEQLHDGPRVATLDVTLAGLLYRLGRSAECLTHTRRAIDRASDAEARHELTWILAASLVRTGQDDEVLAVTDEAVRDGEATSPWHARLVALASITLKSHDLDLATTRANDALAAGQQSNDRFAMALAYHSLSLVAAYRNDNRRVVELTTQALDTFGDDQQFANLCLVVLNNRVLAWLNLDATAEAERDLIAMRSFAERAGGARALLVSVPAAEFYYRVGRWDDALTEVEALGDEEAANHVVGGFIRRGVGALIAAHREDWTSAEAHLDVMRDRDISSGDERNNAGYLLMARAVHAEAHGDLTLAAKTLADTLDPAFSIGMHLRYLWLPELTRLALACGDDALARAAAQASAEEAETEPTEGKTAAAERCAAMIAGHVEPLLAAVETYRRLGRALDLGQTLEEAAVRLATLDHDRARAAYVSAVEAYASLGALWDIRRAESRLRPLGMRRPGRVVLARAGTGWSALSPTEVTVARLVARNLSNPAIAAELFVSRRTVESHVAHIFAKLGARSRVEVARLVAANDEPERNAPPADSAA